MHWFASRPGTPYSSTMSQKFSFFCRNKCRTYFQYYWLNQLLWLRWILCPLPRQCALSLGTDSPWLPESVIWWLLINCNHHHHHVLVLSPFWMTMINGVLCCRCYPHSCPLLKITPSRGSSAIYALTKIAKGHSFQNARTRWCYFFKSTMLFIWLCTRNPLFLQNYLM